MKAHPLHEGPASAGQSKLEVSIFGFAGCWSHHKDSAPLWVMYLQTCRSARPGLWSSKGHPVVAVLLSPAPREVLFSRKIIRATHVMVPFSVGTLKAKRKKWN